MNIIQQSKKHLADVIQRHALLFYNWIWEESAFQQWLGFFSRNQKHDVGSFKHSHNEQSEQF